MFGCSLLVFHLPCMFLNVHICATFDRGMSDFKCYLACQFKSAKRVFLMTEKYILSHTGHFFQ